jgi:hypothetical protein
MRNVRRASRVAAVLLAACTTGRPAMTVQEQLELEYSHIVAGFVAGDPEPWISRLTPDFTLKLFNGSEQSRDWVVEYVRNNARAFSIDTLRMSIMGLTPTVTGVVARVRQTSSRRFRDDTGQLTRLDVDAIQLEEWTKREGRWMLRHVTESEVLHHSREPIR